MELQTDKYGEEVTWELAREDDDATADAPALMSGGPYGEFSFAQVDRCVPSPARYNFTIHDAFGDGMNRRGYYKIFLDGRELVHVNHYGKGNAHRLRAGYDPTPTMTERDDQYLMAHNVRRREWHEAHNATYVPLAWSPGLAEESRRWAVTLLDACDSDGIEHEPGVAEGENLAKNKGIVDADGTGWGQLYPVDSACR